MKKVVIKAENLCKSFDSGGVQTNIIDHLDLEVYKGDFTIIMGPSGAGKSTLLYALSGMDKPASGTIIFNDIDISGYTSNKLAMFRRENCGFIFQQMFLLDYMSLSDNILAAGFLLNQKKRDLVMRMKELFKRVNISENVQNKFPNQISGGEAQRSAIVRALINNPDVIFADEPTGALNSSNSEAVLDILTELNQKGQSIIMVTHDVKSALRGNRILFFRDGTVCGECDLRVYTKEDKERDKKLRDYLQAMNW